MRILIDIGHPAQLNFYLNAIKMLSVNHEIFVTYVDRGKLPLIINEELSNLPNCNFFKIGKHNCTKLSVIVDLNIIRPLKLFIKMISIAPDIELSNGFQAAIYPKLFGKKSIHFNDDFDKSKLFKKLMKFFADEIYVPFWEEKNIKKINVLKEWAYLSPKYFKPDNAILKQYNLKERKYIFVREVITGTMNYSNQDPYIIESIKNKLEMNLQIVLSLEDKTRKEYYPSNWIILKEPITDIHSLMYFSKIIISSGDSMAREGAQLGVPSIYCGIRDMPANKVLEEKDMLFHIDSKEVSDFVKKINNREIFIEKQEDFRKRLLTEWDDLTEFIIKKINSYKKVYKK